ncbi:GNAT family N-acetyltransferase [Limosilactobacillus fermentum]|uniref:GNAT family N-acetyltransferase n=1 Tax=Limosilactobacillus fermentum TaxID=1613 RepID=UPI002F26CBEB
MKITPELVATDPASMKVLQQLARETFKATFDANTPPGEMAAFLKEYYTTESMEAELTDPNTATYFFKNEGGEVVGFLKLSWKDAQTEPDYPDAMELQRIYLRVKYQGHHLGRQIMDFAMQEAKKSGVPRVWLGVWEHNYPAQKIYGRYGFKRVSQHAFMVGDDPQTDFILMKDMTEED